MARVRSVRLPVLAVGALALAGFAWAAPAHADESASDDRLRRLEEALRRQSEETERLRRDFDAYRAANPSGRTPSPDEVGAAVDAYLASTGAVDASVVATHGAGGIRWGGYLNLEFHAPSEGHSEFDLHRLILAADGPITDRIDFSCEIEFEHGGVSDEIDGEIVVEKAEVVFHACEDFEPKAGWLLIPFGRFNLYHDDPINDFTVRPFTARFLVPTGFGQPGIGVQGAKPFGAGHVLSYDVALTNGYRDAFTADEGVREARQGGDENEGKQLWGRVAVTWCATSFLDVLETELSGTWARYDAEGRNDLTGWAVDVLVRKGPFEAKGEYVAYDYERDDQDPADAIEGQSGAWVEAAWHFFPTFWCGCRSAFLTDTSLFTLAARWQWMDLDDHVTGATFEDDLAAWSLGLNWRVTERTVFRVDHTWFDAEGGDDETEWTASFSTYF
jgi:hypothetical protein